MDLKVLHDKPTIFNFLEKDIGLQLYLIGDLDDFFWPKTIWYSLADAESIKAKALLYVGMDPPILLAFNSGDNFYSVQLLEKLKPILPNKMNVHLSPHLLDVFGKENRIEYYGFNNKMQLTQKYQLLMIKILES